MFHSLAFYIEEARNSETLTTDTLTQAPGVQDSETRNVKS